MDPEGSKVDIFWSLSTMCEILWLLFWTQSTFGGFGGASLSPILMIFVHLHCCFDLDNLGVRILEGLTISKHVSCLTIQACTTPLNSKWILLFDTTLSLIYSFVGLYGGVKKGVCT